MAVGSSRAVAYSRSSVSTADIDALVYDLDGTLVRLDVDWAAVTKDATAALRKRDVTVTPDSLWTVLQRARETGHGATVEEIITEHERAGANRADRLPLADTLPVDLPTAVCSLNAESACRIALERFDLATHVETVIGRDSVDGMKPDPEPLVTAVNALGVTPEQTLFVGDSDRDAETAKRAGTAFMTAETFRQEYSDRQV